jgi:hypothetical protein
VLSRAHVQAASDILAELAGARTEEKFDSKKNPSNRKRKSHENPKE